MHITLALAMVVLAVGVVAAPRPAGRKDGMAIPITKRSRSPMQNADQTVNFDALERHVAAVRGKILHGFDNFEKNTGQAHPSAIKEVAKRGNSDNLTYYTVSYYSMEYYSTISVGTSSNSFSVAIDTASSDLILSSISCDSTCSGHNLWDPTSTSATNLGQMFYADYGFGDTAIGEQYTDTVILTGYTATNQALGAVMQYSTAFESYQFPADGLLGLGFNTVSNLNSASSVMQTLVSQGQLPDPVFSLMLAHSGGELYVGGANPEMYLGEFTYAPVTTKGYWEITMDSIATYYEQNILQNITCVIDSSAYLIIGRPSDVLQLHTALGGSPVPASSNLPQGYYTLPCDTMPPLYLSFGGRPFTIPAADINLGYLATDSNACVSAIVGQDISLGWVLGDVFLRNVYTQFDVANARVGFAFLV